MKWKKYFEYKIKERGFSYYCDNKVHDMKIKYNLITSIVDGSNNNEYEVTIYLENNDIDTMYCSCPYAYSNEYCKHMAATLYEYDDMIKDAMNGLKYKSIKKSTTLKEVLDNIDEKTLKEYIIHKFSDDDKFIEEFVERFQSISREDFEKYKKTVQNVLDVNLVKLGYYEAKINEPINEVIYDIINTIDMLCKNNQIDYAQQLLYIIYEKIGIGKNVDQYIYIYDILSECNKCMMQVIEKQDITDKDKTYNYFIKILKNKYNTYTAIYILDLCLKCYTSRDYQRNTLNVVNDIIENKKIPSEIYYIKGQLMINLDYPYKDIKEELFMHRKSPTIQELLIESAIKDEEYDEAIRLLESNSKSKDTELLMDLYKKVGNTEKYKEKIKIMLFKYDEIKYLDQLKDVCTKKEWDNELKNIIKIYKRKTKYEFINEIYIHYHKYEDLYKYCRELSNRNIREI